MDTKKVDILKALVESKGVVSPACLKTGTPRSTFYLWLKEDAEFEKEVSDIQEVALDFGEERLFNLIDGGDTTATIFFLKTRGKKRGYIEKTEIDHSGALAINWQETKNYGSDDKADQST